MGLFSSETVTTVSTSVSRVVADKVLPNSTKSGVLRDLIRSDNQMVENIQESLLNSVAVKAGRMYSWAKKNYVYGLPALSYLKNVPDSPVVSGVIRTLEGVDNIFIEYSHYDKLNTLHFGWQTLVDVYGYDQHTNELKVLSVEKGAPVYLKKIRGIIPASLVSSMHSSTLEQWGTDPVLAVPSKNKWDLPFQREANQVPTRYLPYLIDAAASEEMVEFTYGWSSGGYQEASTRIPITLSQEDQNKSFFQVKYYYLQEGPPGGLGQPPTTVPVYKYFTYQDGLGTYPELDAVYNPPASSLGEFFPFIYFRLNKQDQSEIKTTEAYADSVKLCKFMNIGFDGVSAAINSNPNINDVEQAIFVMAVPANTTNPHEQRYLFDFFNRVYVESGASGVSLSAGSIHGSVVDKVLNKKKDKVALVLQDQRFKMSVGFSGIRRKYIKQVLGKQGDCFSGAGVEYVKQLVWEYDEVLGEVSHEVTIQVPYYWFKKQITPGMCSEVRVYELATRYFLGGSYSTVGKGTDPTLLIPIDNSISSTYSLPEREALYSRSMHYVFNAKKETEVSWYQQEWFTTVLIVVAVVWTVFSFGSDGGSALGAAITAGNYALASMIILESIVIGFLVKTAIDFAMKFVAKMLGIQFALILAAALAVVAAYYGVSGGIEQKAWAENLLTASNSLVKSTIRQGVDALQDEYSDFLLDKKEKTEALEKAQGLLEQQTVLSPFVIFGESPDAYFNRTVHAGNIGVLGISAIENYCSIALRLPELEQTINMA